MYKFVIMFGTNFNSCIADHFENLTIRLE